MTGLHSAELDRFRTRRVGRSASRLIAAGGLSDLVSSFAAGLSELTRKPDTTPLVDAFGRRLWQVCAEHAATIAARNDGLSGDDDRPLYWARLAMTAALADWRPRFRVDDELRNDWWTRLDRASRGMTSTAYGEEAHTVKVLLSGFDPGDVHRNPLDADPSGAAALSLHGRTVTVGGQPVRFAGVVLPTRYSAFDAGIVEKVFGPHLDDGPNRVDLAVTVSRGTGEEFVLDRRHGRPRHPRGRRDNEGVLVADGTAPPGTPDGMEAAESTLPFTALREVTGPFPVRVDGDEGGPTDATTPPGGFLDVEAAYRLARQRDVRGATVPAGSVRTPALPADFGPDALTSPEHEERRAAIVTQTRALLSAAVAVGRTSPTDDPVTL